MLIPSTVLGVFLATSDAQNADVECFAPETTTPLDDNLASCTSAVVYLLAYYLTPRCFQSPHGPVSGNVSGSHDIFAVQRCARYVVVLFLRQLPFMKSLVIFACLSLLFLAIRRHRKGDQHMWHGPVTSCAWFNSYGDSKQTQAKTSSSSILPVATAHMGETVFTEKPERKASARRERQYPSSSQPYSTPYSQPYQPRNPYRTAEKAKYPAAYTRHGSGSAPRHGSRTTDLENGGMLNPYSRGPARGPPR